MDIPYSLALEIFGLKEPVLKKDINTAYRQLAKSAHPDKGGNEKLFCFITECKELLLNGKCDSTKADTEESSSKNSHKQPSNYKKDAYITLSDLYDLYYSLYKYQKEYNITEIRMNTRLYIYPRFKRKLQKAVTITATCNFSNLSEYGYVPLKCSICLPKDFDKYEKFSLRFDLLSETFKLTSSVNKVVVAKLEKFPFNTILEISLNKSNG